MSRFAKLCSGLDCLMAVDAAYGGRWLSPLRDGVALPRPPRNFGTDPQTWYLPPIGLADDFTFEAEFYYPYEGYPSSTYHIFGNAAISHLVRVSVYPSGYFDISTGLLSSTGAVQYLQRVFISAGGAALAKGWHTVRCRVAGETFYASYDAEPELSVTGVRKTDWTPTAPATTADTTFRRLRITNATAGERMLEYPATQEERVRLLEFTNAAARGGWFTAITPAAQYNVASALDLRGYAGQLTLFARVDITSFDSGVIRDYVLIAQGSAASSVTPFSWGVRSLVTGQRILRLLMSDGSTATVVQPIISGDLTGVHTYAATIDLQSGAVRYLIDGVYAASGSLHIAPFALAPASTVAAAGIFGTMVTGQLPTAPPRVSHAAIFNRLLSDGEIAALHGATRDAMLPPPSPIGLVVMRVAGAGYAPVNGDYYPIEPEFNDPRWAKGTFIIKWGSWPRHSPGRWLIWGKPSPDPVENEFEDAEVGWYLGPLDVAAGPAAEFTWETFYDGWENPYNDWVDNRPCPTVTEAII